jgi:hypothetical protein
LALDRGEAKSADTSALEKQIDEMVYALYGLCRMILRLWRGRNAKI